MTHNMHSSILGWIKWDRAHTRTFVYCDGSQEKFENVTQLIVMKTGCQVLKLSETKQCIVAPGWRYFIQEGGDDLPDSV